MSSGPDKFQWTPPVIISATIGAVALLGLAWRQFQKLFLIVFLKPTFFWVLNNYPREFGDAWLKMIREKDMSQRHESLLREMFAEDIQKREASYAMIAETHTIADAALELSHDINTTVSTFMNGLADVRASVGTLIGSSKSQESLLTTLVNHIMQSKSNDNNQRSLDLGKSARQDSSPK